MSSLSTHPIEGTQKTLIMLTMISLILFFQTGIDFALLSLADHSIMTYGTFGLWAALFAGGEVTMPRYLELHGTRCDKNHPSNQADNIFTF